MIDVEQLLQPVSPENPVGPDVLYTSDFGELERATRGTAEQQVGQTTAVVAAEEPDWKDVLKRATALMKLTKDLRVTIFLNLGLLKVHGLVGFADGLAVLRGLLDRYWDTLHPKLDPEDNNDPLERVNILAALSPSAKAFDDPMKFPQRLREAPLCASRQLGRFGLHDIAVASGEAAGPTDPKVSKPDTSLIEAAFNDTSIDDLQAIAKAAAEAAAHLGAIETFLDEKVGSSQAPDLTAVCGILGEISKLLQKHLSARGVATAAGAEGDAVADGSTSSGGGGGTGEIRNRGDVDAALQRIVAYFEKYEPSSPIPLLLRRARRLLTKNFWQIIEDLTPDALGQIKVIGGPEEDGKRAS